jgi:hypothetical protein
MILIRGLLLEVGLAAIGPVFDALPALDMMKASVLQNFDVCFTVSLTTTNASLISVLFSFLLYASSCSLYFKNVVLLFLFQI